MVPVEVQAFALLSIAVMLTAGALLFQIARPLGVLGRVVTIIVLLVVIVLALVALVITRHP